jgi:hypothetical protein
VRQKNGHIENPPNVASLVGWKPPFAAQIRSIINTTLVSNLDFRCSTVLHYCLLVPLEVDPPLTNLSSRCFCPCLNRTSKPAGSRASYSHAGGGLLSILLVSCQRQHKLRSNGDAMMEVMVLVVGRFHKPLTQGPRQRLECTPHFPNQLCHSSRCVFFARTVWSEHNANSTCGRRWWYYKNDPTWWPFESSFGSCLSPVFLASQLAIEPVEW